MTEKIIPYTIYTSADIWRAFKSKCAAEGVSIKEKLLQLITNYLNS